MTEPEKKFLGLDGKMHLRDPAKFRYPDFDPDKANARWQAAAGIWMLGIVCYLLVTLVLAIIKWVS